MSKILTWCTGLALISAVAGCGQSAAVRAAGSWGPAIEVPGLGALNKQNAAVTSVSCAAAGSCAAGGYYGDRSGHRQGFVAAERNDRWGRAIEVPGLGALNKGGQAHVDEVSCAAAGSCVAGGSYRDRHRHDQGFVVGERRGRWGRAIEVPGLGALNKGGQAHVDEVSCAAAGSCVAGGSYRDRHRHDQGFVVGERNGLWGKAIEVPGLAALNTGHSQYIGGASVSSVSCAAAGNCAAGGYYVDRHNKVQAFVADERHGRWRRAIEVPGLGALNVGGFAGVNTVSCGSAGNCAAGGFYANDVALRDAGGPFVATERGGRWRKAVALRADGEVNSISCLPPGSCLAGGQAACENCYYDVGDAFVVEQRAGRWRPFRRIPGLLALEHHGDPEIAGSWIDSVACPSPGNCAVSGSYIDKSGSQHAFVAVERNGRWGSAIQVPGLAALSTGGLAEVSEVSCGSAGDCAAGGYYTDRSHHHQGFVIVERDGR